MSKLTVYRCEITSANVLGIEVGTTGPCGGDSGHGGRTVLTFYDLAGTDIEFYSDDEKSERNITLRLGGDTELETLIEALEFAVKVLKLQSRDATSDLLAQLDQDVTARRIEVP